MSDRIKDLEAALLRLALLAKDTGGCPMFRAPERLPDCCAAVQAALDLLGITHEQFREMDRVRE